MSDPGDHVAEMPPVPLLDDTTIDAIVDGDRVPDGLDHLAAFATGVRAVADRPPPAPSPELAALLTHGVRATGAGGAASATSRPTRRRHAVATASGLRLVAKVGVATTAVAVSVVGAAAAGVLPGDTDGPVRRAIEAVSPVEFSDGRDRQEDRDTDRADRGGPDVTADQPGDTDVPSLPGEHGDRVSSDATGEADGESGVDGPTVADQAPGAAHPPAEPPGQSEVMPPGGDPQGIPGGSGDTPGATAPPSADSSASGVDGGAVQPPALADTAGGAP